MEEKGTTDRAFFSVGVLKYRFSACMVTLPSGMAATKAAMQAFKPWPWDGSKPGKGTTALTCISFSVMVPVLSTQSTSARARASIHFMSCTSTFREASRMTLTTNATLASRYSPSGIMPITAATMETMLLWKEAPANTYCCTNRRMPMGTIRMPITPTSLSSTRSISERCFRSMALASRVSREI